MLCAHACLLSSLIKLRWTQSSLKSGECRSLKLGTKIWDLAQGTWHRNLEHGSMLQICNAIHCFDSSSLSQHKRCPAKRSLPRFKLSTTLPSLQPSPIHKNMPLASHKRTCMEFYSIDVLLSALCNSKMRLSRGAVLHTMSKRAKFSYPTHNIWRWLPTMYIPSVNPVCFTLVPSDLSLSIR